jgi:hypothetical protein
MESRAQREKEEVLMLKESFHQLGKLQQECNDELSTFQRENFIAHEELRSISAGLFQAINDFQAKINAELDKLTLRINQLEIVALNAFDVAGRRVLSCPNARFMVCAKERIILGFHNGDIRSYSASDHQQQNEIAGSTYDPLSTYGRISQFSGESKLFVGFSGGNVVALDIETLQVAGDLHYHKAAITAIHQFEDSVATACSEGIVVLWNANTLARLVIAPYHRLPITGLINDGRNWLVADRTGVVTIHDQLFADCIDKYNLAGSLTHLFQHGTNRLITVGEQLLMWEGKRVVKTFDAVPIEPKPVCCMKKPELLLLGSQTSTTLKCVFLESLLFPKTIRILDAPPLSIIHFSSSLYVLTVSGTLYILEPSP